MRTLCDRRRTGFCVTAASMALFLASCASLRVPLAPISYPPEQTLRSSSAGIELRVRPILSQDEYLNFFDDFLPEIGIAALWVEVRNSRADAIEIMPSHWRLETNGRKYRRLSVQNVFERYYHARHIRMYTAGADEDARHNMERIAFQRGAINPSTEHAGLIFFAIDPSEARRWNQGAALHLGDIRKPDGSRITIRIDISHAEP